MLFTIPLHYQTDWKYGLGQSHIYTYDFFEIITSVIICQPYKDYRKYFIYCVIYTSYDQHGTTVLDTECTHDFLDNTTEPPNKVKTYPLHV